MNTEPENKNGHAGQPSLGAKAKGAMLAAACGDALGWPQEMGGHRNTGTLHPAPVLLAWNRRTGARFHNHVEKVRAGDYSDDTQLILSTARSLRYSTDWIRQFSLCELPAWLSYERGGGRATKASAESWLKGLPPWEEKDASRYFDAGGNGVAMRILPHCVVAAKDPVFSKAAKAIIANGVTTHGHPRALVGALAYGYVLWYALRSEGTLPYGALVTSAISDVEQWSGFPAHDEDFAGWIRAREKTLKTAIDADWHSAVQEQVALLQIAATAMKKGALSVDDQTLDELGCFDKRHGAAGTRTAAAAIFLASRYAADPMNGLLLSAFAAGTDTDTLASMTGGILGAIAGQEWLGTLARNVQDDQYLLAVIDSLLSGESRAVVPVASRSSLSKQSLVASLENQAIGQNVKLPDGRRAEILERITHDPGAFSWRLRCEDGQTLYVKRLGKNANAHQPAQGGHDLFEKPEAQTMRGLPRIGAKIYVADVSRVRDFYEKVLGFEVKPSNGFVSVGGILAIFPLQSADSSAPQLQEFLKRRAILWIEPPDFAQAYREVKACGVTIITSLDSGADQNCFRCLDPAGNLVEVYKHKVVQKTADSTSDGKQIKTPAFTGRNKVGTTWSPEEEQQLRKAFATHKPITEIAATHGRTAAAITARLAKLGLVT
jgi:ADP-ribosylglycohydrolase